MKMLLKTNWQIMHKPLIVCCIIPFAMTLVFTILCIVSPSPRAEANPWFPPLFCLAVSLLLVSFIYFIFTSIRISFDGERLTFYKFFLPVKSFSVRDIGSVEYSPWTKYLIIDRKYAFVSRLFPENEIDALLTMLSQSYGIRTGKL